MKNENIAHLVVSVVLVAIFIYSLFFSTPTYTVEFNTDGGNAVSSVRVKKNKTLEKPEDPTKEGYKFVSWTLNGVEYDFTTPITDNIKLTATWEETEETKAKTSTTTTTKKTTKKSSKKK